MIELSPDAFHTAVPLFQGTTYGALVFGTLAGGHPGRVFVDNARDPKSGLVCTRAGIGYYFLAGRPDANDVDWLYQAFISDFVPAQKAANGNPEVLMFFDPQVLWKAPLFERFADRKPVEIFKHRFTLPASLLREAAEKPGSWQKRLPEGFRAARYTSAWIEQHPGIAEELRLFYGSADTFLEHSLGVCVLKGDALASTCHAVFTGCGEAEISIATVEAYRRQGLAQIAAAVFIEACAERGLDPIWGCWPNNAPSVALAQKLGFVESARQPVCLWVDSEAWRSGDRAA